MTNDLRDPALSILLALLVGRRHGYAIIQDAAKLSKGRVQLRVSSLYAALDRLESEGLVARDGDEAVDGRLRRYFAITELGESALRAETDRLEQRVRVARSRFAERIAAKGV